MSTSREQQISQQSQLQFPSINHQVSCQQSKPNLLNQAFIVYSDDDIQSNSQSYTSISNLSNLSRHSSSSSVDNYNTESNSAQNSFLLKGLSHYNEESSVYNIHQSECSESGIQLLHALQPLFKGKVFLRKSPRFAVYGQTQPNDPQKKEQLKDQTQTTNKKHIDSQMIEDDKPQQSHNILQSRIIQENYETPTSIFSNIPPTNNQQIDTSKQQPTNPFIRYTRSSKKNFFDDTNITFSNVDKNSVSELYNNSKQQVNDNQYVSRMTKDYIMMNRKEKRIRKHQQKQTHNSYSLKGLRKRHN